MPHKISLVDKDGNQSEVTLPDFALDSTQQQLLKNIQALVKANPKAQKAYEDLIDATKDAVKATEDASDVQKKTAEEIKQAVDRAGDKQMSALKQFRTNFADRVGKDMRDTFTAGGNILTTAIKAATVSLAAGAGLLYKTFMDTSDAFRQLAQSGLGGADASGTGAQDAIANLTRLGMSANDAASMLTSFGQASAVLGKANFSKFVAGVASAGSFAADLGLTLEEAAEFAADEIDIRQRSLFGQMQLDEYTRQTVMESIQQTQRFSAVMGRSMKDINASKKAFFEDNAEMNSLLLRLSDTQAQRVDAQMKTVIGAAASMGGDFEKLMQGLMNAASRQIPITDSNLQAISGMGPAGMNLINIVNKMSKELNAGDFSRGPQYMNQIASNLANMSDRDRRILEVMKDSGDQTAAMIINAAAAAKSGSERLRQALSNTGKLVNDPMVTAGANFQNVISQVSGALVTARNQVLGQFAPAINDFAKAITNTGMELTASQEQKVEEELELWKKGKKVSEEEIFEKRRELQERMRQAMPLRALNDGLAKIADSFMKKFFPNLDKAGNKAEEVAAKFGQFIKETTDSLAAWIDGLEGDTASEKVIDALGKGIAFLFKIGVTVAWEAAKEVIKEHWGKIMLGVMGIILASTAKTFILSAVAALAQRQILGAGSTAASAITVAGNQLAAAIRNAARQVQAASMGGGWGGTGGRGRKGGKGTPKGGPAPKGSWLRGAAGKASLIGIGTSLLGGIAATELEEAGHTKTAAAVDTTANVAGMAGTGMMIGSLIAPGPGTVIGGVAGGLIGAGMSAYQHWGTWFGSDEAQEAVAEKGQEAIDTMDSAGLAAMAMNPEHIRAVSLALKDFNAVSVANISKGLAEFNPALTALFDVITKLQVQFVEVVNNKLGRFLDIITKLNVQGAILPNTTTYIDELTSKIISIPVEPILKLSTAFNALTTALKDFGDLTTDTRFGRMWDAFTGKEDQTESVIKVLNNFASKVDSDKLLKAAQATQAYNAAMQGMATPVDVQRTSPSGANTVTTQDKTQTRATTPQVANPMGEVERLLQSIKISAEESAAALRKIRDSSEKIAKNS